MAFDLQTIQSDARYLALGDSTDSNYADTDLNRNINRWYQRGIAWILENNGDWQVKGTKATRDLVSGKKAYTLPSNILKLNEVYIKYQTDGKYHKAKQRDPRGIPKEPDQTEHGYFPDTPEFDLQANSIVVYIPSSSIPSITAGLKIHFQKEISNLSGNTDEPDIAEPFRRLLSTGAAYDYCKAHEMRQKATDLSRDIFGNPTVRDDEGIKGELKNHYANRSTVEPAIISPQEENFI